MKPSPRSRFLRLAAGTALLSLLAAGCGQPTSEVPTATIGLLLPLATDTGQQALKGAELAVADLNEMASPHLQFQTEVEDSQGDPTATGTRAESLAGKRDIVGIVGPVNSGPATAAADVANRAKVVLVSPLASTPVLARPGDFFFRTWPSDATEARFSAKYARESLALENVAVLTILDAYGQGLSSAFAERFVELGGTLVSSTEYPGSTQDFGPLVQGIPRQSLDALYYVGFPPDMAEVLREIRSRGMEFTILSAAIVSDPGVASLAGKNAEGVIFPFPATYGEQAGSAAMNQFRDRYRGKYGEDPGFVAAQSYDAAKVIGLAVLAAQGEGSGLPDRDAVRDALDEIGEIEGATGTFRLDENGDAVRAYRMFTIRDGAMQPFEIE